jgi:opine dehydrogenase
MIITVVGAGNAGSANAFVAAEAGHEVRVLETASGFGQDEHFEALVSNGGVWGIDNTASARYSRFSHDGTRSFHKLAMVTRDPQAAIDGADMVMIFIQTRYHGQLAERIAPYFSSDQTVILVPGYLQSILYRRHCDQQPLFGEGESTACDARITEPGCVKIIFKNARNAVSFMPAARKEEGLERAREYLPSYTTTRENILATALHNPNMIVHTVGMYALKPMMDYCARHHADEVPGMYEDALGTDFAWAIVDLLDTEKMNVLEAFGCERIPYLEACRFRNEPDLTRDPREVFDAYRQVAPPGPRSFDFRYITEDVPYGLVLLSALGDAAGVPTPTCDHLIQVVNSLLGRDFYAEGLTLEKLGLDTMSREEILEYVSM